MYVLTHFSWMIGCVSGVNIYTVKCKGAPRGGGRGPRGGFSPILPKIMCYINFGVFNSREFKNEFL